MRLQRRAFPPAWYRDPLVHDQLRRWNGWRWTADTRRHPTWLRNVPIAVGPRRRSPARLLWVAAVLCLGAAVWSIVDQPADERSDRITSSGFVTSANALCSVTAHHFESTDAAAADRAERTRARAEGWAAMAESLRELEVAPADRRVVASWLAAWDQWVVDGRAYAEALATGDDEEARAASERSEPAKRLIDRAAIASGMPACRFTG